MLLIWCLFYLLCETHFFLGRTRLFWFCGTLRMEIVKYKTQYPPASVGGKQTRQYTNAWRSLVTVYGSNLSSALFIVRVINNCVS